MSLTVKPSEIFGSVYIQISKSDAHRALISASLAKNPSVIKPWINNVGTDIEVTKNAAANFADFELIDDVLRVIPKEKYPDNITINVMESGTSLRLLIPIISALGINCTFTGSKKLFSRPMDIYKNIWKEQGLLFDLKEDSLTISGKLRSADFYIPGNISSQFVSGLLFALPLLEDSSKIIIEGELESAPYVMMTLKTLKSANIDICKQNINTIEVYGNQEYSAINYEIESDWSHAAFFAVAGAFAGAFVGSAVNEFVSYTSLASYNGTARRQNTRNNRVKSYAKVAKDTAINGVISAATGYIAGGAISCSYYVKPITLTESLFSPPALAQHAQTIIGEIVGLIFDGVCIDDSDNAQEPIWELYPAEEMEGAAS